MLLTIGVLLLLLWVTGFIAFHVVSLYIHILLILAIIAILTRLIRGK